MAGLSRACTKRDSRDIFRDDTLELFIGHRPNFAETYWHIAFNAANTVLDNVALERAYDIELVSATRVLKDAWVLEIAIPLKGLPAREPPFGKTWRANICRNRSQHPRELSAWSAIEAGFHAPQSFGTWVFAER